MTAHCLQEFPVEPVESCCYCSVTQSFLTFQSRLEIDTLFLALHKPEKKQSLHLCHKEFHRIKGS